MRKWLLSGTALVLGLTLLLTGCLGASKPREPEQIGQLADNRRSVQERLIYLQEAEQWVPYIVLSADYGGNALLLRQEVLEEPLPFDSEGKAYYAESEPDRFLNETFAAAFSPRLREEIADTEIEICRRFPDTEETEVISRKLFLLSAREAGIDMEIVVPEGEPLDFFADQDRLPALLAGEKTGWWLRSTYMMDRGLAWQVHGDGSVGGSNVRLVSGIRPALCLPPDLPVVRQTVSDQTEGFVLRLDG